MRINANSENTILSLKVQTGTMSNGKPRYKSHSYSNIATSATNEDLYAVAQALGSLFKPSIGKITRQDLAQLLEEI